MKTFISIITLLLSINKASSQIIDSLLPKDADYVSLTAEVKLIDSEYYLIPQLKVLAKDSVIQIPARLYYCIGDIDKDADISFSVEKIVACRYQRVYFVKNIDRFYKDTSTRNYRYGDSLNDRIKLDDFVGLEVGKYQICVSWGDTTIYSGNRLLFIKSYCFDYDVPYAPRKPDYCK